MKRYRLPALLLLVSVATLTLGAFAQENMSASSSTPLAYSVENTGAHYPAPVFPGFDWLPIIRPLPDPFRFFNGTRSTSLASWERRRNEIKASIEKYEIGAKPDKSGLTIAATYTPPAAGATSGTLQVVVTRIANGKSLTLNSRVYIPQGWGEGPFPALIPMSLAFPPFFVPPVPNYGSLPASAFANRPIATVDFFHNDVTEYSFFGATDHSNDPFYQLYPEFKAAGRTDSDSGQYAAWAWGVSRLIDGIEIASRQEVNPLPIDPKYLAVTGCSYAGKMALYAGALDERIALTIPQESGGGGATSWRVSQEIEGELVVESLTHTDHTWFASQLFQFSNNNVYKLPHDHHELMAMVAPRALLETGNTDFNWLSNRSNYITARATQRIYNTLGVADRFGFYIDGGHPHCGTLPAESPAIEAFLDKFLLGIKRTNTYVRVYPYPETLDYQRWTWWWGKPLPAFPNDWNPGDGTVVASALRPLVVKPQGTVQAGYAVSIPGQHAAATALLMGANVQLDILRLDGRSYTLTVPLSNATFAIGANDNSWLPSSNPRSPLVYQGAAPGGAGGIATTVVFSALGQNDGGAGNPAGAGLITDSEDSIQVKFHADSSGNILGGIWSQPETVTKE